MDAWCRPTYTAILVETFRLNVHMLVLHLGWSLGEVALDLEPYRPVAEGSALSTSPAAPSWCSLPRQKRPFCFYPFFLQVTLCSLSGSVLDFPNTFKDHLWNKHTVILLEACQPLISSCWLSKNMSCHFSWVFKEAFVVSEIYFFFVGVLLPQTRTSLPASPWPGPAGSHCWLLCSLMLN